MMSGGMQEEARSGVDAQAFERDVVEILRPLQGALRGVMDALQAMGSPFRRAADLERALKLDTKLAWQVFKFVNDASVFSASAVLPGMNSMSRFLAAAKKKGVEGGVTERVAVELGRLEAFIAERVGNRAAYDSIVTGGVDDETLTLKHRKSMFRSAAHLLGVQTDVITATFALHPGAEAGQRDLLMLNHRVGVQRLRPSARVTWKARVGETKEGSRFEPIEPMPNEDALAGVIRKYCSNYSVETIQANVTPVSVELELASTGLGSAAASDWTFGIVERNTRQGVFPGDAWYVHLNVAGAHRVQVIDVMLHDSMQVEPSTRVDTYVGVVNSAPGWPARTDMVRMDVREHVEALGRGLPAMRSGDVPQYGELMAHVMERLGWNPGEFRTYRCRVEYPVFGSAIELTFRG